MLVLIGFVCSLIFSLKIVHRSMLYSITNDHNTRGFIATVSAVRLIILGISCIASIIIFAVSILSRSSLLMT